MPIKVQSNLPAIKVLESENIFVMPNEIAIKQDIRPLKIIILNLMPTKITTETQLLRLLGNSPLQVDIELLQMASHTSKNTSPHHLTTFYKTFDQIKDETFDGMIITGTRLHFTSSHSLTSSSAICFLSSGIILYETTSYLSLGSSSFIFGPLLSSLWPAAPLSLIVIIPTVYITSPCYP